MVRSTRRQLITSIVTASGAFAILPRPSAASRQQPKAAPDTANRARTSLHQEPSFKATPQRLYEILLDAKQFAACTGAPAEIDPKAGGAFTLFAGLIVGRTLELIPNQRIVQAWRPTHWADGVYSLVKFELKPHASETTIVLDHAGFPEGDFDSLTSGWDSHYWQPLKKYLP